MVKEFGTRSGRSVAAIGPSIGPCCYEVGSARLDAFRRAGATDRRRRAAGLLTPNTGSLRLDLWAANRDQLLARRPETRIASSHRGLCTQTHRDVFESYRVDGTNGGPDGGADCGAVMLQERPSLAALPQGCRFAARSARAVGSPLAPLAAVGAAAVRPPLFLQVTDRIKQRGPNGPRPCRRRRRRTYSRERSERRTCSPLERAARRRTNRQRERSERAPTVPSQD